MPPYDEYQYLRKDEQQGYQCGFFVWAQSIETFDAQATDYVAMEHMEGSLAQLPGETPKQWSNSRNDILLCVFM